MRHRLIPAALAAGASLALLAGTRHGGDADLDSSAQRQPVRHDP